MESKLYSLSTILQSSIENEDSWDHYKPSQDSFELFKYRNY